MRSDPFPSVVILTAKGPFPCVSAHGTNDVNDEE